MVTNKEVKRRVPRIGLRAEMRYYVRGAASEFANVISNNISILGVGFSTHKYIAPQTILMLEIEVLSRVLHPIGRVAWCQALAHSDQSSLGVEFIEMDPLERHYLKDYIYMQTNGF